MDKEMNRKAYQCFNCEFIRTKIKIRNTNK